MANEERVVLIAEVRDEATASLDDINKSVEGTQRQIEDTGKKTEKSTGKMTTAFERFSRGGSKSFQRFSGGMRSSLDRGMSALGDLGTRISESDTAIGRMVRGGTKGLQDFASGFNSPMAAASSFTGVMGNIGGAARSGLDSVSGAFSSARETIDTAITRAVDFGDRLQEIGPKVSGLGGTLTKAITLPAAGAAAAAGGITAKLGWDRLTSLDSAQAQLRGLGYEGEDVERITGNLVETLEGGMMTMGEGTSTAAGALAAGVEEGAELERYIQLVDAAAVGMGRSVDETAMIFGRVQGSGRMMTQELNMIEESMPGFSAALSDSLDVGQDKLREMVTAGEISSDQFMDVMDGFAGGMATEYAESWEGMVANTKNYIGILGENLLGGVFEQSKESIAGFVDFLASDEVAEWATSVGESIGNAFETVIGWVQSAIEWWTNLDGSTQKLIGIIAGIAVAIGPVLLAIGTTITVVGKLLGALAFLANPITWIIAGIAALTAGLTWFFTQTEIGQTIVSTAWEWIQAAISTTVDWATDTAWPMLQTAWEGISAGAVWLWDMLVAAWEGITAGISATVDWMVGTAWPVIQSVWDGIVTGAQWLWGVLEPIFIFVAAVFLWVGQTLWNIYTSYVKMVWDAIVAVVTWAWENVIQPIFQLIVSAFEALGTGIEFIWESVLQPVFEFIGDVITWLWENMVQPYFQLIGESWSRLASAFQFVWEDVLQPVFELLGDIVTWLWEEIISPVIGWIMDRWQEMALAIYEFYEEHIAPILSWFGDTITGLYNDFISPAVGWIMDRWGELSDRLSAIWNENIKPVFQAVGDFIMEDVVGMVSSGVDMIADAWFAVANFFREPINWVIDFVWNDGIAAAFNAVADAVGSEATLGNIPKIGKFGGGGGGDRGSIPGYADGGLAQPGWAMVGEEGPELVNFSAPGRVYTADETRDALTGGTDANPPKGIGAPAAVKAGMWAATSDNAVAEFGRDAAAGAISWVRGKFADTAERLIDPLVESVTGWLSGAGKMGDLAGGLMSWGVDSVMDWIRGEDAKAVAGGQFDGEFTANPGGFNRPAAGMITSRAGSRAYSGAFGGMHYGVDIGNSIGTAIRAAWSGVVRSVSGSGMDQRVVLNHGDFDTAYFHNSDILASPGDEVTGGQQIARMGTAGTGPHLHFEYHPGGWYNPSIGAVNALFDDGGVLGTGTTIAQNNTGKPEFVLTNERFGQVEDALDYVSANLPDDPGAGGGGTATTTIERGTTVTIENITIDAAGGDITSPEVIDQLREAIEEIFEESERRDY